MRGLDSHIWQFMTTYGKLCLIMAVIPNIRHSA